MLTVGAFVLGWQDGKRLRARAPGSMREALALHLGLSSSDASAYLNGVQDGQAGDTFRLRFCERRVNGET